MPLKTMNNLLIQELAELYAAEVHNAGVLPELARSASNTRLASELGGLAQASRERTERLDEVFNEIGAPPYQAESKGMRGLLGDCMSLAALKDAEPHVRDAAIIAVAQHVTHDKIAGYGCAKTWAGLLGFDRAATRLQKSLAEARQADRDLSALAESINRVAVLTTSG